MLIVLASVALAATAAPAADTPAHTAGIEHRGATYSVEYHALIESDARVIGAAPPTRQNARRCELTLRVSIERRIYAETGSQPLAQVLPGTKTYTTTTPGRCHNAEAKLDRFAEGKQADIHAHIAHRARSNHEAALAAIDAAHHIAAN